MEVLLAPALILVAVLYVVMRLVLGKVLFEREMKVQKARFDAEMKRLDEEHAAQMAQLSADHARKIREIWREAE